jgi:hypothetical protein
MSIALRLFPGGQPVPGKGLAIDFSENEVHFIIPLLRISFP